jgi:hypothetical protein
MLIKRTAAKAASVTAFTLGVIVLADAPAFASTWYVYQGDDYAVVNTHDGWVAACDMETDGHSVYGVFQQGGGSLTKYDSNGSAAGCGNATFTGVVRFKVCEAVVGPDWCSGWRTT